MHESFAFSRWLDGQAKIGMYFVSKQEKVAEELLETELKQVVANYKFGVLYAKEGQTKEQDMFSNGVYHFTGHLASPISMLPHCQLADHRARQSGI